MDAEISCWQETVSAMPDKQFFATMRLYLGEIKTPYNKQRLTEQLTSFLKNPEISANILSLLDSADLQVLTALSVIPCATEKLLADFFAGSFQTAEIYAMLVNLSERLLIFKTKDEIIRINPVLAPALGKVLSPRILFPVHTISAPITDDFPAVSPDFLAALFSFLGQNGIGCKADGTIKKNYTVRLSAVFTECDALIQVITSALINLSILKEDTNVFRLDKVMLSAFAELETSKQYALLCAASVSRQSREGLRRHAQLLLDALASVPPEGITQKEIVRLAFLIGAQNSAESISVKKSRFSMILDASRSNPTEIMQGAQILERMISSAITMGLLCKIGRDESGEEIFAAAKITENGGQENPKVLNIDSIFSVTIMPGLALKNLVPLTSFMSVKKSGIATEYEINRQSAAAAFDQGKTPDDILALLENYLPYEIPQSLRVSIAEWHADYSAAKLYRGFVLKVDEAGIARVENNPRIKGMIAERLAPGIYLLDIPPESTGMELHRFISASGLDFLAQVRQPERKDSGIAFPPVQGRRAIRLFDSLPGENGLAQTPPCTMPDIQKCEQFLDGLKSKLQEKNLDKNQKESLLHRIQNRMIVSESQLTAAAVRPEILEADGIDFAGKIRLLETAAKDGDLTELRLPNADGSDGTFLLLGIPLSVSKQPGEAVLRFQVQPTGQTQTLLVSRISHVRRLRF